MIIFSLNPDGGEESVLAAAHEQSRNIITFSANLIPTFL